MSNKVGGWAPTSRSYINIYQPSLAGGGRKIILIAWDKKNMFPWIRILETFKANYKIKFELNKRCSSEASFYSPEIANAKISSFSHNINVFYVWPYIYPMRLYKSNI